MNSLVRITRESWREFRKRYVVKIDYPRMDIKGMRIEDKTEEPDFKPYVAFMGIPYARKPERFQPPEELTDDDVAQISILKANNPKHQCLQLTQSGKVVGKEDCLYLNIYLSKKPKSIESKLPVLVLFDGQDTFHNRSTERYIEPVNIVKQNLVFVTVYYRLGIFGFLNMGTDNCRGNAGLKDQVMALKWIKKNIDRFGGDPTNVTIQGYGSAATCVNLHMISPMSQGYFHKAIVSSGGIYCPWGFLGNESEVQTFILRSSVVNSAISIVENFKNKKAEELLHFAKKMDDHMYKLKKNRIPIFLGPTEEQFPEDAFIPRNIEELKKEAIPVPLMAGICKGEGYLYIIEQLRRNENVHIRALICNDSQFDSFLQENFHWSELSAMRQRERIMREYFPNLHGMTDRQVEQNLAHLMTDIWYRRFYDNFKIGNEQKPFYVYQFVHLSRSEVRRRVIGTLRDVIIAEPSHGDDFNYLYNPLRFIERDRRLSSINKRIMNILCKMIGDFCKNGDFESSILVEETKWLPHDASDPCYLYIGRDTKLMMHRIHKDCWKSMNALVSFEDIACLH